MYRCSLCNQETELDEAAVMGVETVLRDIVIPLLAEKTKVSKPVALFCEKHPTEEANLYCFTCESKCFCVQCLVSQDLHKSHDVRNI